MRVTDPDKIGYVAFRSGSGTILLHLMREGDGYRTLCGRYTSDHTGILTEDTDLPDTTRACRVCDGVVHQ